MEPTIVERTTRAAVLKAVLDAMRTACDTARAEADEALRGLHQSLGVTQLEVRLPGSADPVAQISLSQAKPAFRIDEAEFLAWCQTNHPGEVETVTAVRPAWRKALLARIETTAGGQVIDGHTGQVLDFLTPVEPGPAGTTLSFKTGGRAEVTRACRDGRLNLADVLAPGGQEQALPAADG